MPHAGTVKWFNDLRGYGFIEQPTGPDVYVHYSAIEVSGYRTLRAGAEVEFELERGPEPRAARVIPLEKKVVRSV